jgi:IS5 family transposase
MKIIDKNTILTTIFTIVDDALKVPKLQAHLHRFSGPQPDMSDSEVITVALYEELIGEPREDHFYRLHADGLRPYFPKLLERSRYNRRKRDLWKIILAIRVGLLITRKAYEEEIGIVDSAPVPVVAYKLDKRATDFTSAGYGRCSSKAMKYFGYKLHTIVTLCGNILDFMLSPASPHDSQALEELVGAQESLLYTLGDKAYWSPAIMEYLREQRGIILLASKKKNQKQTETEKKYDKQHNKIRLLVETINAQLQEQFHLSKHYAKSTWGLMTRVAAKVTMHTLGTVINQLYGRPPLSLASLAV